MFEEGEPLRDLRPPGLAGGHCLECALRLESPSPGIEFPRETLDGDLKFAAIRLEYDLLTRPLIALSCSCKADQCSEKPRKLSAKGTFLICAALRRHAQAMLMAIIGRDEKSRDSPTCTSTISSRAFFFLGHFERGKNYRSIPIERCNNTNKLHWKSLIKSNYVQMRTHSQRAP